MKDCCIIIPTHKKQLNSLEEIYVKNNINIFKNNYDIILVCPIDLDILYYKNIYTNIIEKRFDNKYFTSSKQYNILCTSSIFYKEFINDYKYMLICQTDAAVFYDNLQYFIDLGYDYYGAPWPDDDLVGNGGLSLRNIKSLYDVCKKYGENQKNEDLYFCIDHFNDLKICPLEIAKKFSLENNPQKYYNGTFKPMGCHQPWADYISYINFWNNYNPYINILNKYKK